MRRYLDILSSTFMVRQLAPWHENVDKRQVKAPKIYFWDSGLLHCLMRQAVFADLEAHPKLGASWEGFALEQVFEHHRRRPRLDGDLPRAEIRPRVQVWRRAVHDEIHARGAVRSEAGTAVRGSSEQRFVRDERPDRGPVHHTSPGAVGGSRSGRRRVSWRISQGQFMTHAVIGAGTNLKLWFLWPVMGHV